jgi:hypothetical protein
VVAVAIALVFTVAAARSSVQAQTLTPPPAASPTPSPTPTAINSDLSAGAAVTNLGSNFLERLGNQATNGFGGASASLSLSNTARLYLNYDGKFRAAMQSHQGTAGVEPKW